MSSVIATDADTVGPQAGRGVSGGTTDDLRLGRRTGAAAPSGNGAGDGAAEAEVRDCQLFWEV